MAAATMSAVDLGAQSRLPLRLGASIAGQDRKSRWSSVRYNHKPRPQAGKRVESRLQAGQHEDERILALKQGEAEWRYSGRRRAEDETYVLVLSADGTRECTLERLEDAYAMNLIQTPEDSDADRLAQRYPHIHHDADDDDDNDGVLGGADAGDAAADPNNPFDFRHFLSAAEKKAQDSKRDALAQAQAPRSTAGTPLHQPVRATPASRPAKAAPATMKRKKPSVAATKPNPKRVRAGQPDPPRPAASSADQPKAPEIRLDRTAATRQPPKPATDDGEFDLETWRNPNDDDDDDGELILENAAASSSKHGNSMSLALSGAFAGSSGGPRSLRSAASSPGSRVNSPHPAAEEEPSQQTYEFEFGDSSPQQGEEADAEDDDNDVEDLELGSPVHESRPVSRRPSKVGREDEVVVVDEEDDMEAQLALAMAQQDEEAAAPAAATYESEEDVSEEE